MHANNQNPYEVAQAVIDLIKDAEEGEPVNIRIVKNSRGGCDWSKIENSDIKSEAEAIRELEQEKARLESLREKLSQMEVDPATPSFLQSEGYCDVKPKKIESHFTPDQIATIETIARRIADERIQRSSDLRNQAKGRAVRPQDIRQHEDIDPNTPY